MGTPSQLWGRQMTKKLTKEKDSESKGLYSESTGTRGVSGSKGADSADEEAKVEDAKHADEVDEVQKRNSIVQ